MCKNLDVPSHSKAFFLLVLLTAFGSAKVAQANPHRFDDKLCTELARETQQFVDERGDQELTGWESDNPIIIVLDAAMSDLEGEAHWRVQSFLMPFFTRGCVSRWPIVVEKLQETGVPDEPTVGQVIDGALSLVKLDRSKPAWNLRRLPELDFETHTLADWDEIQHSIPPPDRGFLVNDVFQFGYRKWLERYDLSDPKDLETALGFATWLSFEYGNPKPIGVILDEFAVEAGLTLK